VYVIQIAIQLIIQGLNSLRGVEKTFQVLAQFWQCPTPDYSSIRQWGLRLGLYELNRQKEYGNDWIFILDMTLELGKAKCLVILGISQQKLTQIIQQEARGLQHQDVEVLALEVMKQSAGTVIAEKLKNLALIVGTPVQIVSDWGSDIKKGINLYLESNPGAIATYDVTHKMANLLEKELAQDERYQNFLQQCSLTRQRTQQTELSFLMPPKQRSKARYHNVDVLVEWAEKVLRYQQKQDFYQISTTYSLDRETLLSLVDTLTADSLSQLVKLMPKVYANQAAFRTDMLTHLGQEVWQLHGDSITQAADLGRRKFDAHFGWLSTYQPELDTYADMVTIVQTVETQLKTEGLHRHSLTTWSQTMTTHLLTERGQNLKQKVSDYLAEEGNQIPEEEILLGTSDVIESLFGKYKIFSSKRPLKDIGASILTIPLSTLKMTGDLVQQAMEAIRSLDVHAWSQSVFGSSMLSQRRTLQSAAPDTKVA
jgi:hypothetical protein